MAEPDQGRAARARATSRRSSTAPRRAARSGRRSTRSCCGSSASTRSTIVFVNNRRGGRAPRAAPQRARGRRRTRTDDPHGRRGARRDRPRPPRLARARGAHSSSRSCSSPGELPCLVATSSLELGIDMGAVDLVIQVESPKSVARGLQRIGRAGHSVGEVSKGRIFPKFRADLLECAVVAQRMREGEIEETVVPRNPLDVLAQQIVAMAAVGRVGGRRGRARSSRATQPFAELSREQLENVLDMLDGRYPSERVRRAAPADRLGPRRRARSAARKGARQLAVTNAGTIPDRGLYGVHLPDGRRVGELDEEMVYEARPGQTFLLGASTWRIEEITRDRVIVTPAPGVPGRGAVLEGRRRRPPGGARRGDRRLRARGGRPHARGARAATTTSTSSPPRNLLDYLREQQAATRVVPSRPRRSSSSASATRSATGASASSRPTAAACTPPGGWRCRRASATSSASRPTRSGPTTGSSSTSPTPTSRRGADLVLIEPDEIEDLVVARARRLGAVRRALPRERRPRAADPARLPGQAHAALAAAAEVADACSRSPSATRDFPIILETYRECLRDVLDLPGAAASCCASCTRASSSLVEVETPTASPFASSLLFDYVATYMYEGDTPNAERRAAALSLDRDLLRELLGQEELRELIDPERAGARSRPTSSTAPSARAPTTRDALAATSCAALGDLTADEARERVLDGLDSAAAMLDKLRARAPRGPRADRRRGALDRRRGRRPLPRRARRRRRPAGCRRPSSRTSPDAAGARWCAATRAPTARSRPRELARRATASTRRRRCASSSAPATLVRGELRPGGTEREWCDPEVLRRLRRASLAVPAQGGRGGRPARARPLPAELAGRRPPPRRRAPASTACARCSSRCRASRCPPRSGSATCCRAALGAYSPTWLDQLCASGEVVWIGAGALGRNDGRVALYFREDVARSAGPPPANAKLEPPDGPSPRRDPRAARRRRRASGSTCSPSSTLAPEELQEALWDLVWAGEVTNDAFAPLRAPRLTLARAQRDARRGAPAAASARAARGAQAQVQGRWSLTAPLFARRARPRRAPARARPS